MCLTLLAWPYHHSGVGGVEGEVGGGGRWGNRLHITSKLGQLNLDSLLSTLTLC